ncbi:MAG: hypothetical protein LAO30_15485 [Acidobacteriia bacterium]|nr:hypothetical protein [Terriglobia bacterium]
MGLRFFLVEAAVFFFDGVDDLRLAGALFADGLPDGLEVDDWDWAMAGNKTPSPDRRKTPAKTATAKRRTQSYLPSAESWHP